MEQKGGRIIDAKTDVRREGGIKLDLYVPPFKRDHKPCQIQDESSLEYQEKNWIALQKTITGLLNKVDVTNIRDIIPKFFSVNLVRGRSLFCQACLKSQMAGPGFTDVFAAVVAVINTKIPDVGHLLLKKVMFQFYRAYMTGNKRQLLAVVKFLAHLVNQQVVHELIALELLTILLENRSDDSLEVAVGFLTECGSILLDLSPKALRTILDTLRGILHEGEIDKRVQFMIEGVFALRRANFQGHPAVRPELDLVDFEDQLTHKVSFLDEINAAEDNKI